jgi:hypothetical protein
VIVGLIALAWGSLPAWLHVGAIVLLGVAGALYVRWVARLEAAVAGSLRGSG